MKKERTHRMGIDGMAIDDHFLAELREEAQKEFSQEARVYADPTNLDWTRILSLLKTGREDLYEAVVRNLRSNGVLRRLDDKAYVLVAADRVLDLTPLAELGFSNEAQAKRFAEANGLGTVRKYSEVKNARKLPVYGSY